MPTLKELINQAKLLVPTKLLDDDPLLEENWNMLVDLVNKYNEILVKIDSKTPAINSIYFRLPGMDMPEELYDGYWEDISSTWAGLFFRVAGGNALPFGSGAQGDAMRKIVGTQADLFFTPHFSSSGAFALGDIWSAMPNGGTSNRVIDVDFDSSRVAPTAVEVRPINKTIEIWIRRN